MTNTPVGFKWARIADLPADWQRMARPDLDEALAAWELPMFEHALAVTGGNQLRAAQLLGINRNTLRKRLSELSVDLEQFTART